MKQQYARLVTMAAWTATIVATLLLIVKVITWWVTGSVSLLASLIDSMLDIAASVVNIIVVRYSLQPADREHTFGHGKAESLAALAQAMFISGSAVFLILNGVERFFRLVGRRVRDRHAVEALAQAALAVPEVDRGQHGPGAVAGRAVGLGERLRFAHERAGVDGEVHDEGRASE